MRKFRGDLLDYVAAVNAFEGLSATPEATARLAALERYSVETDGRSEGQCWADARRDSPPLHSARRRGMSRAECSTCRTSTNSWVSK